MSDTESQSVMIDDKVEDIDDNNEGDNMGNVKTKIKKIAKLQKGKEEMEIARDEHVFMCGVVEGFYGRPWTAEQRKELFRRMEEMGLNTYLYGPKDDYKHRLFWREKYSSDEAELLKTLIDEANAHNVTFVYAISPGLDMVFGSEKEITALQEKLMQVKGLGCKAFALLFDDIDPILCASDREEFKSSADAQASITNQMFDALDKPRFLFCPTEYCNSMAIPDVKTSPYLTTLGTSLNPSISVMWTGTKVVSNIISVESIKLLNGILRRKVMIWDNIHANDYDPKRVFLGPYKGRSTQLIPHISGVLTNPNCEFESNFIAMHTIATWWKSHKSVDGQKSKENAPEVSATANKEADQHVDASTLSSSDAGKSEVDLPQPSHDNDSISSGRASGSDSDTDSDYSSHEGGYFPSMSNIEHGDYNPDVALEKALRDWLPLFLCVRYPTRKVVPRSGTPPALPQITNLPVTTRPPLPDICVTKSMTEPILSVGENDLTISKSLPDDSAQNTVKDDSSKLDVEIELEKSSDNTSDSECAIVPSSGTDTVETERNPPTDVDMANTSKESNDPGVVLNKECSQHSDDKTATVDVPGPTEPVENAQVRQVGTEMVDNKETTNADVEMKEDSADNTEEKVLEEMQTSPKITVDQMETEEIQEPSTPMQTDDLDSDVSMATAQSGSAAPTDVEDMATPSPGGAGGDQVESKEVSVSAEKETFDKNKDVKSSESDSSDDMCTPKMTPLKDPLTLKFESEPLTVDDLRLLAQCFFLPYEHGYIGKSMVQKFKWLRENAIKLSRMSDKKSDEYLDKALEWSERALSFEEQCRDMQGVFNRICACPNRALLYDIFPYLWDMKGVVTMLRSYIKWLGRIEVRPQSPVMPGDEKEEVSTKLAEAASPVGGFGWLGQDPEPWVFRGGLSGEFQRLLPVSSAFDLFCQTLPLDPQVCTYIIRPYVPSDEKSVFDICYATQNDGLESSDAFSEHKQLPADRLVGALLTLSPEYCFIVEDEEGLCGYLAATLDARKFWKKYELAYLPEMREKYEKPLETEVEMTEVERMIVDLHSTEDRFNYGSDDLSSSHPSLLHLALHPRASSNISKSMLVCLLSALKSHHSSGAHTLIPSDSLYFLDLYTKLGFTSLCTKDDDKNIKILGRTF